MCDCGRLSPPSRCVGRRPCPPALCRLIEANHGFFGVDDASGICQSSVTGPADRVSTYAIDSSSSPTCRCTDAAELSTDALESDRWTSRFRPLGSGK